MPIWRWIAENDTGDRDVTVRHEDRTETEVQTYDQVQLGDTVGSVRWLLKADSLAGVITKVVLILEGKNDS